MCDQKETSVLPFLHLIFIQLNLILQIWPKKTKMLFLLTANLSILPWINCHHNSEHLVIYFRGESPMRLIFESKISLP